MPSHESSAKVEKHDEPISNNSGNGKGSGDSCPLPSQTLIWEYECSDCKVKFETAVPRGPKEEGEIRCPQCLGKNIQRINVGALATTACGG